MNFSWKQLRRSVARVSVLAWACGLVWAASWPASAAEAVYRNIRSILEMPLQAVATNPVVDLTAVVSHVDESYEMRFLQDETGGIYLYRFAPLLNLQPGDVVRVTGRATRGLFAPILDQVRLQPLGRTNIPPATPVVMGKVASGALVGSRIEVQGVVENIQSISKRHFTFDLYSAANSCTISVCLASNAPPPNPTNFLDCQVMVRGVVASRFNRRDQAFGFQVLVNGLEDVQIQERPPKSPFETPVIPINELSSYHGHRLGLHRDRVQGVVTLSRPGRLMVIQDRSGAVVVQPPFDGQWKVGEEVDVAGYLSSRYPELALRNVEMRSRGLVAAPTPISVESPDPGTNLNHLVRIYGQVVGWSPPHNGEITGVFSVGNRTFQVVIEDPIRRSSVAFPPGTVVSATGILRGAPAGPGATALPSLWLRDFSDLSLMRPAPASPWQIAGWVGVGLVVLLVLCISAVIWGYYRCQQTEARRLQTQAAFEQRHSELELQLSRSRHEGESIAQELHDNIIQSIYSVGLSLDETRRLMTKDPETLDQRLHVAIQSLNSIIADVRSFIVGLEPKGLKGHELKAALKSCLLAGGEDQQARFSIQIDAGAARDLTSQQATEIFNIAREAMMNSLRHSHARLTTVTLVPRGRFVRLEVVDDGVGFNSAEVKEKSMGLRHMKGRARNLGATLEVISVPGQGVRIILDVPITTHDNH